MKCEVEVDTKFLDEASKTSIKALEAKIRSLETTIARRDGRIRKLESEGIKWSSDTGNRILTLARELSETIQDIMPRED